MGAQKKKAKFIAKGHLASKLKQRNVKKKFQALKSKKKGRFERNSDAPTKKRGGATPGQASSAAKDEDDMLDDMDVDDFLNAEFLDSGDELDAEQQASDAEMDSDSDAEPAEHDPFAGSFERKGGDDDGDSSSEEEDESALDPRYLGGLAKLDDDDDDDDKELPAGGDDDDDDAGDADAPVEQVETEEEPSSGRTTLTMALLAKAEKECFEGHSAGGLRRMMKIFSDACRSSDAADMSKAGEIMYDIQSSAV